MKTISLGQWFLSAIGVFFIGAGAGCFEETRNFAIALILIGLVLEIPAFYLVYKHKKE
jgi:hypothetical protein